MANTKENENNIMSTESLKNILEIIDKRDVNFFMSTVAPNIRFTNENIVDLIREVVSYRLQNEGVSVSIDTDADADVDTDVDTDTDADTDVDVEVDTNTNTDTDVEVESEEDNMKKYNR